jgi:predicted small secreted protein
MLRKIILLVLLAGFIFSMVGCQTVKGLGEDVKSVGEAGEEVVD